MALLTTIAGAATTAAVGGVVRGLMTPKQDNRQMVQQSAGMGENEILISCFSCLLSQAVQLL